MNLLDKKCMPCDKQTPILGTKQINEYMKQLMNPWELIEDKKIKYQFRFKTFQESIDFVNKVATVAEEQNHHPSIFISFNKVSVTLTTHTIGGLSENDFIMAVKIESLL